MEMEINEALLGLVKEAVRESVAAFRNQPPNEVLGGYALVTDDGLVTLSCMAISKDALEASEGDDLRFSPTEWPYEESTSFDRAEEQLRATQEADESRESALVAFATLVQALAELREEGLFAPQVFLSVLSSDPSPLLERLEADSVVRLNQTDIVEARGRFIAKWAR